MFFSTTNFTTTSEYRPWDCQVSPLGDRRASEAGLSRGFHAKAHTNARRRKVTSNRFRGTYTTVEGALSP